MTKVKLTKNELKEQRDALKRCLRYLPTLQLKKQQLQLEARRAREALAGAQQHLDEFRRGLATWSQVAEDLGGLEPLLQVQHCAIGSRQVAGIELPVFEGITLAPVAIDLFATPPWYDDVVAAIQAWVEAEARLRLLGEQMARLEDELRIVSQRVNLFEKVKIPEAKENIRRIQISLGDQQANAVGRAKIAKRKCAARDAAVSMQAF